MPTYKLAGERVLYFAGWTNHYSLYPASDAVLERFGEALAAYEVEKKTIRFPLSEPVPAALIAAIAGLRAREVGARQTVKPQSARKSVAMRTGKRRFHK